MTKKSLIFLTKQSSFKIIRKIARINGTEGMNAQFTKEENQMANKHMEKYSASLRNVN